MKTKFIFENGTSLTPAKQAKLIEEYHTEGMVRLQPGYFLRSIQTLPADPGGEMTTIIVIYQ